MYAGALVAIVLLTGWLLTLAFRGPGDVAAVRLSGVVVLVVQLAGFAAIRALGARYVIAAWGVAAMLRLVTLVVYAVIVVKVLAMPLVPALMSMAVFFFLSTLIEPLFLRL
jgi:hypothetical protein